MIGAEERETKTMSMQMITATNKSSVLRRTGLFASLAAAALLLVGLIAAQPAKAAAPTVETHDTTTGASGDPSDPRRYVGTTEALFLGTVNPNGLETVYKFQYSEGHDGFFDYTDVPGPAGVSVGDGTEDISLKQKVTGLAPDTAYEFRLVARNAEGTSYSQPVPFMTFGVSDFVAELTADDTGAPATEAGSHPFEFVTEIVMNQYEHTPDNVQGINGFRAFGSPRDLEVDLPPGFVGNPTVVTECSPVALAGSGTGGGDNACPLSSQIGRIHLGLDADAFVFSNRDPRFPGQTGGTVRTQALYNMAPPPGVPAQFGFNVQGASIFLNARVRNGSDYGFSTDSATISQVASMAWAYTKIWGVPQSDRYDAVRGPFFNLGGSSSLPEAAFFTTPTRCDAGLEFGLAARTWENPETWLNYTTMHNSGTPLVGCENLPFEPDVSITAGHGRADSPAPYTVRITMPHTDEPDQPAQSHLYGAEIQMPEGVSVNPAAAHGLEACTEAEIGLDNGDPVECPDASKIGSMRVETPLLDEPLGGAVYQAEQEDNPFGSTLAIYLVIEGPGILIKLPGEVSPDPDTGRITTKVTGNPQTPFTDLRIQFAGGDRGVLANPTTCGPAQWEAALTPWSAADPDNPTVEELAEDSGAVNITTGPDGGACATTEGDRPFDPEFAAWLVNPQAGGTSPLKVRVSRDDGEQEISALDIEMPQGILASLAGKTECSDAAANAGNCPASSQLGSVAAAAGAGPTPFWVTGGKVFLTEGYGGGQLGLLVSVPAEAGPLDLGDVNVRSALHIDPITTEVRVVSDPIPQILEGVPLRTKKMIITIDEGVAPTDCTEKQIAATIAGASGATSNEAMRFQALGCRSLGFDPNLAFEVTGTGRSVHPELIATLDPLAGGANIAKALVRMPDSLFLDQGNLANICTRAQYAAENCPADSQIGTAEATTPLLDDPVSGNVYLVASDNPLPDLVADLNGQIDIDLHGVIFSGGGVIGNDFLVVPDAPVESFNLTLKGGPGGLLVNSRPLCAERQNRVAQTKFVGHNGAVQTGSVLFGADECLRARLRQIIRKARLYARAAERAQARGNERRARKLRQRSRLLVQRATRVRARL